MHTKYDLAGMVCGKIVSELLPSLRTILKRTTPSLPPDPERMVGRVIARAAQPQLLRNIDVSIHAATPLGRHILERTRVALPGRTTVRTRDLPAFFTRLPLIKARLVQIVATSSLAPYDLFAFAVEVAAADRAVAFYWLAAAVFVATVDSLDWQWSGIVEDLVQLGGEKSKLVSQVLRGFEHLDQDV